MINTLKKIRTIFIFIFPPIFTSSFLGWEVLLSFIPFYLITMLNKRVGYVVFSCFTFILLFMFGIKLAKTDPDIFYPFMLIYFFLYTIFYLIKDSKKSC